MKFALAIPFLALFFTPFSKADARIISVTTTQVECDGPYPMTTLLDMIELTAKEAQNDLLMKCQLGNHPGHVPGRLTGRQKLEHFSVEDDVLTCVKLSVTQDCDIAIPSER